MHLWFASSSDELKQQSLKKIAQLKGERIKRISRRAVDQPGRQITLNGTVSCEQAAKLKRILESCDIHVIVEQLQSPPPPSSSPEDETRISGPMPRPLSDEQPENGGEEHAYSHEERTALHATPEGLSPNSILLQYQIEKVLGQGGFGITYLARDTRLDMPVAIKEFFPQEIAVRQPGRNTIRPKSSLHRDKFHWIRDRFLQEARTLAGFRHPHIVRIHNFFETNDTAYIVMEYEEGRSLDSIIKKEGRFDEKDLLRLILPVLDGLKVMHGAGFIHRDIKPGNIFIRSNGTPVLLDFGSTRQVLDDPDKTLTAMLTPGYAPLEQYYNSNSRQGPWTDIYALGAVMYRALFGRVPEHATERGSAVMRHEADPLIPATELGKGLHSPALLNGINACLSVLEKDRPQNTDALKEILLADNGESIPERQDDLAHTETARIPDAEEEGASLNPDGHDVPFGQQDNAGESVSGETVGTESEKSARRSGRSVRWGAFVAVVALVGGWVLYETGVDSIPFVKTPTAIRQQQPVTHVQRNTPTVPPDGEMAVPPDARMEDRIALVQKGMQPSGFETDKMREAIQSGDTTLPLTYVLARPGTTLNPDTAQELSRWNGLTLCMDAAREPGPEAMKNLTAWRGRELCFEGLESLSASAASQLALWPGDVLRFKALGQLTAAAAKELSAWRGRELILDLKTPLSSAAAKAIAAWDYQPPAKAGTINASSPLLKLHVSAPRPSLETISNLVQWPGKTLVLDGQWRLSKKMASQLGRWSGKELSLPKITQLTRGAAKGLAAWRGERLRLDGLERLDSGAALALGAAPRHGKNRVKYLHLNGLKEISDDSAHHLNGYQLLELSSIEVLNDAKTTHALATATEELLLDGVTTLSREASTALSKHKMETVSLASFDTRDRVIAANLGRIQAKNLRLGIKVLNDDVGYGLSKFSGRFFGLCQLETLPPHTVNHLISIQTYIMTLGRCDNDLDTHGLKGVNAHLIEKLKKMKGHLMLGLYLDNVDLYSSFSAWKGNKLILSIHTDNVMTPRMAEHMKQLPDRSHVVILGLEKLTSEVAARMAEWKVARLTLFDTWHLSEQAAKELSRWQGDDLILNSVERFTPKTAHFLSNWSGKNLSIGGNNLELSTALELVNSKAKRLHISRYQNRKVNSIIRARRGPQSNRFVK
ncbi:MAG: serine/threonine protein kinase [Magnetococcales bacterium]|nr:serine/threonine protein kinase [Magnetococcales bacterium]